VIDPLPIIESVEDAALAADVTAGSGGAAIEAPAHEAKHDTLAE
jgi:16S rRNA G966 N2-methylase RsmD